MMLKSLIAFIAASFLVGAALFQYNRQRSAAARMVLLACVCFVLVAATHVLEAFHLVPEAGWGRAHSVGHYVDLTAAWLGIALVLAGASLHLAGRKGG